MGGLFLSEVDADSTDDLSPFTDGSLDRAGRGSVEQRHWRAVLIDNSF